MDFLFGKDLGLRFSSAMFSFRGDFCLKVSKNRDILRDGDDDCDLRTPQASGEICWLSATGFEIGVRGQYPNSFGPFGIGGPRLDNVGSILIFVSVQ
jgi:hypothetical protein